MKALRSVALWLGGLLALFFLVRTLTIPSIFRAHTQFLFGQLDDGYKSSLAKGQPDVTTAKAFLDRAVQWKLDWNSCRPGNGAICDSWGTPIEVRIEASVIRLRSAAADRKFQTDDDIVSAMARASSR